METTTRVQFFFLRVDEGIRLGRVKRLLVAVSDHLIHDDKNEYDHERGYKKSAYFRDCPLSRP
jgi:hypothetical protein